MQEDRPTTHADDAQERELTAALQHIFDTRAPDAQALARIRERLIEVGAGPLPASPASIADIHQQRIKGTPMRIVHTLTPATKTWKYYLQTIAAVLLVGLLLTSFAVVLHMRQGSQGGANPFVPRTGWKQIALYSGTGSKTINGLNVALPQLYGYSYNCVGSGSLAMKLTSKGNIIDIGQNPCQSVLATRSAPSFLAFDPTPTKIETITVKADAATSWFLLINAPEPKPALISMAGWTASVGMGGDTSATGGVSDVYDAARHKIQPKTWEIVTVCIGTGKGTVRLAPNLLHTSLPICDGQPHLLSVHSRVPTLVTEVQVEVTGNIIWRIQLLGCVDENTCGVALK